MRSSFGGVRSGSRRLSVVALSVALLAVPTPPALASDLVSRDGSFSTRIEGMIGIPLITLVDSANPLTFAFPSGPSHGALSDCSRYGCSYTPDAGFIGTDSFTFTANDGILTSNEATVTIEVTPNTVPVARDFSFQMASGVTIGFSSLGFDPDPPDASLAVQIVQYPSNGGTVECFYDVCQYLSAPGFVGTDVFTFTVTDGLATSNVATATITVVPNTPPVATDIEVAATFNQSVFFSLYATDVDREFPDYEVVTPPTHGSVSCFYYGSCSYSPATSFVGVDSFTYRATDGHGFSNVATVTISVKPSGPPQPNHDYLTTRSDIPVAVQLSALSEAPLTFAVTGGPTNGTLDDCSDGECTYIPAPGFSGDDSFTFTAFDGWYTSNEATVTISVVPNNPPVSFDGYFTTRSDIPVAVSLASVSGLPLTFAVTGGPTNGTLDNCADGECTYTPAPGFSGDDSFNFTAFDGWYTSNEATVTISVVGNIPPFVSDTSYSTVTDQAVWVFFNAVDPDLGPISIEVTDGPSHGTLECETTLSCLYTPASGFSGSDQITFVADDGVDRSREATVTIRVVELPVVSIGDDLSAVEGATVTVEGSVSHASGFFTRWSYLTLEGDGSATCHFSDPTSPQTEVSCTDDGRYLLTLFATDGQFWVSDYAILTLENAAPVVTVTSPADRSHLRTDLELFITIMDGGLNDSHECRIDWGDGSADLISTAPNSFSGVHEYPKNGKFVVTVTVTDDDGGVTTTQVEIRVAVPRRS